MHRWMPAAAVLCLHVLTSGGYGFFRDELYFVACGKRLAWGYVDQPPLIALVARLSWELAQGSVLLFRLPAAAAHAALVFLTGRLALRLGGGPFAAALAGACAAIAPLLLAGGYLLTMNAFEPLLWLGVVSVVVEVLRGSDRRLWLAAGALAGAGVLNKHSMVFFVACLLVALLASARHVLRSRWLLAGSVLAVLLVLPHALWQVGHGFPMIELLRAQAWKNAPFALGAFASGQIVEMHPLTAPVWIAGAILLLRSAELRPLGVAFGLNLILFAALKAKVYYCAPLYPALFAAGGVAIERLLRWRVRWAAVALVAVGGLATAPLAVGGIPEDALVRWMGVLGVEPRRLENKRYGALPQHLADQHGWPALVEAVRRGREALTSAERRDVRVFAQNYGEAAALELLGGFHAISGHNSYWLWGPGAGQPSAVLVVGGREPGDPCGAVRLVARTGHDPWVMPYEDDLPVWACTDLRGPLGAVWPRLRHFE